MIDPREQEQRIDAWLAQALQASGSVEPRPGLEQRVLATLQAERNRRPAARPWLWAAGALAVALLLFATIWQGITARRPTVDKPFDTTTSAAKMPATANVRPVVESPHRNTPPQVVRKKLSPAAAPKPAEPRLAQFPSPQPLSREEAGFAQYAARYPEQATLMAREQEQFARENRELELKLQSTPQLQESER